MTQTITRMFASHAEAEKALNTLKGKKFSNVHLVSGHESSAGAGASHDDVVKHLTKGYVLKSHANIFAKGIKQGKAVVVVHAPFGTAKQAMHVLDSHGPVDSGVVEKKEEPYIWDERTPMSSALQAKVLASNRHPFERIVNVPSLTKDPHWASLGTPKIISKPRTSRFGMALLSPNKTPLSSRIGLSTLTTKRRFFS